MRTLKTTTLSIRNRLANASVCSVHALERQGMALLTEEGITSSHLPLSLKFVEVTALNVLYKGVGIRNVRGGMEFYCRSLYARPFTVRKSAITFLPRVAGSRSSCCCLFADFMDYLSYLTLIDRRVALFPEGDTVIMGNVQNFHDMLLESKPYYKVACFFPSSQAGQVMFHTVKEERKGYTTDYSFAYCEATNLLTYVKQI